MRATWPQSDWARAGFPKEETLDARKLEEIFSPSGVLARVLAPGYEHRSEQGLLAAAVDRTLRSGGTLLAEAPTGVGKSLAYLIPALHFAIDRKAQVLVSTQTRSLQDQILEKELPRLRRLIDREFRAELLKGRANYLCRVRYRQFLDEIGGTQDAERVVRRIGGWVETTESGDMADAPALESRDQWVLSRITSDGRACGTSRCTPESGCFYKASRRRAKDAHLLVVNHALLMVDLFEQGSGLPDWQAAVIDEAHHLPRAAEAPLSFAVSEGTLEGVLKGMGGRGEPGVTDLLRRLLRAEGTAEWKDSYLTRLRELEVEVARILSVARDFWEALRQTPRFPRNPERLRYGPGSEERNPFPPTGLDLAAGTREVLVQVESTLNHIATRLTLDSSAGEPPTLLEARHRTDELSEVLAHLEELLTPTESSRVYWIEPDSARGVSLRSAPLDVGGELRGRLFGTKQSLILTSATLSLEGRFEHPAKKLGLRTDEYETLLLPTPFDLERQVAAYLLSGQPDPRDASYRSSLARGLALLARGLRRKMLVLFTSHEMLRGVEAELRAPLAETGIRLLAQGVDGGQSTVKAGFLEEGPAVLLGAATFWEGMDFPGEELEVLVMARLPFLVPTDPVVAATGERLQAEGIDPFRGYFLPEALLRFRQGFGRLIRRRGDRGIFVVADPRLGEQGYGQRFKAAVGLPFRAARSWEEVAADAQSFFAAR